MALRVKLRVIFRVVQRTPFSFNLCVDRMRRTRIQMHPAQVRSRGAAKEAEKKGGTKNSTLSTLITKSLYGPCAVHVQQLEREIQ
jgi:hypothetical protein